MTPQRYHTKKPWRIAATIKLRFHPQLERKRNTRRRNVTWYNPHFSAKLAIRCAFCLFEKYMIICHPKSSFHNRRNELESSCRHWKKILYNFAQTWSEFKVKIHLRIEYLYGNFSFHSYEIPATDALVSSPLLKNRTLLN